MTTETYPPRTEQFEGTVLIKTPFLITLQQMWLFCQKFYCSNELEALPGLLLKLETTDLLAED